MPADSDLARSIAQNFAPEDSPDAVEQALCIRSTTGLDIAINPNVEVEMGSCMKAIILAAACQLMDADELSPHEELELTPDVRVEASEALERRDEGSRLTVDVLLRAMIAVSDNTATEMIQRRIGSQPVQATLHQLGLFGQLIPASVKEIYALENREETFPAFRTTAEIMCTFYERMLENSLELAESTATYFWDVMQEEDRNQDTPWPGGIECYRKSGSVVWDSVNAQAMCGVMANGSDRVVFAMALNRRPGGDDLAEETFAEFNPRFKSVLTELSHALTVNQNDG